MNKSLFYGFINLPIAPIGVSYIKNVQGVYDSAQLKERY